MVGNKKSDERFQIFLQNAHELLLPQNLDNFSENTQEILNDFELIGLIECRDIVSQSEDIFVQLTLDIINSLTTEQNPEKLEEKIHFLGDLHSVRNEDTARGVLDRILSEQNKNTVERNALTGIEVVKIPHIIKGIEKISRAFKEVASELNVDRGQLSMDSYSERVQRKVSKKCLQNSEHFERIITFCKPKN